MLVNVVLHSGTMEITLCAKNWSQSILIFDFYSIFLNLLCKPRITLRAWRGFFLHIKFTHRNIIFPNLPHTRMLPTNLCSAMTVHVPNYLHWLFAGVNEWEAREWVHWFKINIEMTCEIYCECSVWWKEGKYKYLCNSHQNTFI